MPTFMARVAADSDLASAGEFVGIIVANSSGELSYLVDEFCDPGQLEYALLPPGMIYARDGAPSVPDRPAGDDDGDEPDFWSGATISEDWRHFLAGRAFDEKTGSGWLKFDDLIMKEDEAH